MTFVQLLILIIISNAFTVGAFFIGVKSASIKPVGDEKADIFKNIQQRIAGLIDSFEDMKSRKNDDEDERTPFDL